jgi:hypothetical protein
MSSPDQPNTMNNSGVLGLPLALQMVNRDRETLRRALETLQSGTRYRQNLSLSGPAKPQTRRRTNCLVPPRGSRARARKPAL